MIDKNNKSFCGMPFNHAYISPQYERKLCCISRGKYNRDKASQEEFWNSDYMRDVRKKMIRGEQINECGNCTYAEEMGIPSFRQLVSQDIVKDEISFNNFLADYDYDTGEMGRGPTYFDYRTIHCNLQCISCSDIFSSTHQQLSRNMGRPSQFKIDVAYEQQMSQEIIDALINKTCEVIYWAGGEPMVSKIHWNVIDKIQELSENEEYSDYIKSLKTVYTTNLTRLYWKDHLIPDILKTHDPHIHVSIDGVAETFDYCRDGARWEDVKNNWNQYYSKLNNNNNFTVMSVLSAPVLFDIDRLFAFLHNYNPIIHNHKLNYDINSYSNSETSFLDIRLFPKHIFDKCIDNAITILNSSKLRGAKNSIGILLSYKNERENNSHIFDNIDILKSIKNKTTERDRWLKSSISYIELLKLINIEAYEWYNNL